MAVYDIVGAFSRMEDDLIKSMKRNLARHRNEELNEGFNWNMWQAEMLQGIQKFRAENTDIVEEYESQISDETDETLQKAYEMGGNEEEIRTLEAIKKGYTPPFFSGREIYGNFFRLSREKMKSLTDAVPFQQKTVWKNILRYEDDAYRKIIFDTQIQFNAGAKDLYSAMDMASKDFLSQGINCIRYRNGANVNITSYAEMALRTANMRANIKGASDMRKEWGISLVKIPVHNSACPYCTQFMGKVYNDDVYQHPQNIDKRYPRLSEAVAGGYMHPNCKCGISTYYEGISKPPKPPTKAEAEEMQRRYNLEQQQRYTERQIRKYKRLSQGTLDSDSAKAYNNKLREWQSRYRELIDENSDVLRKNPARLRIYDGTEIRKSNAVKINMQFFAESDIKNQASSSLKRAIRKYEKRIDEHIDKINNPQKYAPEWDNFSEQHKKGLIKHWNKEISNFKESIENRKNELNLRGEKYE